ncbi:MAG: DinB family protein, partial [Candidatus Dormibacteraeota bacterium]|nr:DinB family protein [Candidatus Dormibacteraeota bacterium]
MSGRAAIDVRGAESTGGDARASFEEDRRRAEIRASLEHARGAFLELLSSLTEADLSHTTGGSGWTVGEALTHVVASIERVPMLIGALRRGEDYMNFPLPVFERVKRLYTWWRARGVSLEAHRRRFEAAFPPVLALLDTIRPSDWARAGRAYGEGRWTVESALRHQAEHIEEHIKQIRRPGGADNDLYDQLADSWWDEGGVLNILKASINPWRVPYFQRILTRLHLEPEGKRALDVGCGGGLLAEEFATLGFAVTGVDPSEKSLAVARVHAAQQGLEIDYQLGYGDK